MEITRETLEREVHKLDPALKPDDDAFRAAVIMLAGATGASQGTSVKAMTAFTGYPFMFVRQTVRHLRTNRIFLPNGRVAGAEWFEKDGGLAFWLDVNCALGFMMRARQQVA